VKLFLNFLVFFLFSCTPQINCIDGYIDIIGQSVPNAYTLEPKPDIMENISRLAPSPYEKGNAYIEKIISENDGQPEVQIILIANDSNIIQSCYVSFVYSDFSDPRKHYNELKGYIKNNGWQFIENSSGFKRFGELYFKNDIYCCLLDPIYYSVSIGFSENKENFIKEGFCG
jgi:hypothetical protein